LSSEKQGEMKISGIFITTRLSQSSIADSVFCYEFKLFQCLRPRTTIKQGGV